MCISTFEKLASSPEPYYCQGCLRQHLPFSYILNTDSDIFSLENANESQASIPPSLINDAMAENMSMTLFPVSTVLQLRPLH